MHLRRNSQTIYRNVFERNRLIRVKEYGLAYRLLPCRIVECSYLLIKYALEKVILENYKIPNIRLCLATCERNSDTVVRRYRRAVQVEIISQTVNLSSIIIAL